MRKRIVSSFAHKPQSYRYLYFNLSSLKPLSYAKWRKRGEPNPFAKTRWEATLTSRSEILSLFRSRLT